MNRVIELRMSDHDKKLNEARMKIAIINKKLKERKEEKRVKVISHTNLVKMELKMEKSVNVSPPNEINEDRKEKQKKIENLEQELKNINDQLNMLLTTKLSIGDAVECNNIITTSYEAAVEDIESYKTAKVKRKKIKENYAVAICIIEQLTWKLDIDLIRYLNIDTNDKKKKKEKFKGNRFTDKDMNTMFCQLLYRRDELERDIANESMKLISEERQAQEAEAFINEYKEYQRKSCFQRGKFINTNWSKLTKEQKIDRIKSYIEAKKLSFDDDDDKIEKTDEQDRLYQYLLDLLSNNKLKATNIKWKKNLGCIKEITITLPLDVKNGDKESSIENKGVSDVTTTSSEEDNNDK